MSFFGNRRQVEPAPRPAPEAPPRLDPPLPPSELPQPVGFETVLGANSIIEGTLRSAANVRLDGTFTGTLEIGGNVLIGETAKITADVNARNISIAGAVRGNVTGRKVQLLRTGRVWGDIHAQALTTEEGAFIDGKITMVGHEHSPAPAEEEHGAEPMRIIPELEPHGLGATAEDMDTVLPPVQEEPDFVDSAADTPEETDASADADEPDGPAAP